MRDPRLQGKSVCVGKDIIVAATYQAKAKGIKTGTPIWEAKKILGKDGVFLSPDIGYYGQVSTRLMEFLQEFSNSIEVFSIDEAFIDITGMDDCFKKSMPEFLKFLQKEVKRCIGIPVSIGGANTRLLAKMFAKVNKPAGTCFADGNAVNNVLRDITLGDIPFIGRASEAKMTSWCDTALDYKNLDNRIIQKILKWNGVKLWMELNGVNALDVKKPAIQKAISRTRSFNPSFTNDKIKLFSYLMYNLERAYECIVEDDMGVRRMNIFLRTKDFKIISGEVDFGEYLNDRRTIIDAIFGIYNKIFDSCVLYRSTGVNFFDIRKNQYRQMTLGELGKDCNISSVNRQGHTMNGQLSRAVNEINKKYGRFTVRSAFTLYQKKDIIHRIKNKKKLSGYICWTN